MKGTGLLWVGIGVRDGGGDDLSTISIRTHPTKYTTQHKTTGAKTSILLAGQWVCPDLFLRRPAHRFPESRLDRLLDARAKEVRLIRVLDICLTLTLMR